MKAWIERVAPPGERIELPDGRASIVFGRTNRATLVLDEPRLSARHCELSFDGTFWRLRDLGSELGTRVNGAELAHPRALFNGDVIELGSVRLRFADDLPRDDPALLEAITRDPDQEEPWLVFADWLQDHGDPLGERITRARLGNPPDHLPWLGPLWDHFVAGEVEIDWHLGFVRRATLRPVMGRLPFDWRDVVSTLVNLRVGRFVRELSIDVPRLEGARIPAVPKHVAEAQRFLASLPALPATLEQVRLGYHVAEAPGETPSASYELVSRLPRLAAPAVYVAGREAALRLRSTHPGVKLVGITEGRKVLAGVVRVRRASRTAVHLEAPPMPFVGDGDPCFFRFNDGRVDLVAGRMRGEVRVNGRVDSAFPLLPGDQIDLQATARLELEVVR